GSSAHRPLTRQRPHQRPAACSSAPGCRLASARPPPPLALHFSSPRFGRSLASDHTDHRPPQSHAMQHVVQALEALYAKALFAAKAHFAPGGKPDGKKLNAEQLRAHGLAYLATETMACRELAAWSERTGGELEKAVARAYVAELARSVRSGLDLGPCETVAIE